MAWAAMEKATIYEKRKLEVRNVDIRRAGKCGDILPNTNSLTQRGTHQLKQPSLRSRSTATNASHDFTTTS